MNCKPLRKVAMQFCLGIGWAGYKKGVKKIDRMFSLLQESEGSKSSFNNYDRQLRSESLFCSNPVHFKYPAVQPTGLPTITDLKQTIQLEESL
jgi:hypothetical protein